jgi:uncharacterized protein YaeQ
MALKSTIFKVDLQIADMDRNYYQSHALTIAQHPSETEERVMVRILAFALYASDSLAFGKGLSAEDEPDLWQKDLTGAIDLWIDVGLPDEREIRKACGRSKKVVVVIYGRTAADIWWSQNRSKLEKSNNLTVLKLPVESTQELAALIGRTMQLQCTVQDGEVLVSGESGSVRVEAGMLMTAG